MATTEILEKAQENTQTNLVIGALPGVLTKMPNSNQSLDIEQLSEGCVLFEESGMAN